MQVVRLKIKARRVYSIMQNKLFSFEQIMI